MLGKLIRLFIAYLGFGVVATCLGLLIATAIWYLTGFEWVLLAVLALVFCAFGLIAMAGSTGNRPTAIGFWEAYAEMSGRQAGGGSLRDMTRPNMGSDFQLLTNAVLPFGTGVALLFSSSLLY